jgi:hypothetical protein
MYFGLIHVMERIYSLFKTMISIWMRIYFNTLLFKQGINELAPALVGISGPVLVTTAGVNLFIQSLMNKQAGWNIWASAGNTVGANYTI